MLNLMPFVFDSWKERSSSVGLSGWKSNLNISCSPPARRLKHGSEFPEANR